MNQKGSKMLINEANFICENFSVCFEVINVQITSM